MSFDATFVVSAGFIALFAGGLMLLWRLGLSPTARRIPAALGPWHATIVDFFIFIWIVICGGALAPPLAGLWIKNHVLETDARMIYSTTAFQLGMLAGVVIYWTTYGRRTPLAPPATARPNIFLSGVATYLIALPVVTVVMLLWRAIMALAHIPAPEQESIDILRNLHDPLLRFMLLACAIVLAPFAEELIFRAGIFRYLRTRTPRWLALLLPACLFAAAHQNLASFPALVALGVIFALAYERTGRIGTSIVAHALFNLTTTLVVLAGLDV